MREDYGSLPMNMHDDGFGDIGFDTPDLVRDALEPNLEDELFSDTLGPVPDIEKEPVAGTSRTVLDQLDDNFGDEFGESGGLFEGDIFADPPSALEAPAAPSALPGNMTSRTVDSDDDDDGHFDGVPSPAPSSTYNSRPPSTVPPTVMEPFGADNLHGESEPQPGTSKDLLAKEAAQEHGDDAQPDQTTLINNEEESFALAPIDASALKGVTKAKRKRKLIIDEVKNISGEEMKSQLANTTDIVTTLDLAPPTKRLMCWKETGGVEKLFALPARHLPAQALSKNYQRNLVSSSSFIEDFSALGPLDVLALAQNQPIEPVLESPSKRGRKRKHPLAEEPEPIAAAIPAPLEVQTQEMPAPEPLRDQIPDYVSPTPQSAMESLKGDLGLDNQTFDNDSMMRPPATPSIHQISSPQHQSSMLSMPGMPPTPMPPTPSLSHIPMTPGNLVHGSMTPFNSHHGGLDDNPMLSDPALNNLDAIPLKPLNPDTVSSILNDAGGDFANMGYDGHGSPAGGISERIANDWNDYEYPQSVGQVRFLLWF
jgi:cohesin complex subunit SCC1